MRDLVRQNLLTQAASANVYYQPDSTNVTNPLRISIFLAVTAISGGETLQAYAYYTDENGNNHTQLLYPTSQPTNATLAPTVATMFIFPSVLLPVKGGTTMNISVLISGSGTVTYDFGVIIEI